MSPLSSVSMLQLSVMASATPLMMPSVTACASVISPLFKFSRMAEVAALLPIMAFTSRAEVVLKVLASMGTKPLIPADSSIATPRFTALSRLDTPTLYRYCARL